MENKLNHSLPFIQPAGTPDSEFQDKFKTILISLNMAFETAKAGKSGKELYLLSEVLKEQSNPNSDL